MKDRNARINPGKRQLRRLFCEALEPRQLMNVDWRNPLDSLDVNQDQNITPLDALIVINDINTNGSRKLPDVKSTGSDFLDPSGDQYSSPLDALLIINALNRGDAFARTLFDSTGQLQTESSITMTVGQQSGTRRLAFQIDGSRLTIGSDSLSADLLNVYLVDSENTSSTLVDRGTAGTSIFSLYGGHYELAAGLVTWDGRVLEIDVGSLKNRDTVTITLQLLNRDNSANSRVTVAPYLNSQVIDVEPSSLVIAPIPTSNIAGSLDTSLLNQTDKIQARLENIRFDSNSSLLEADMNIENLDVSLGRTVAIVLPGLPTGAIVQNASGTTQDGLPYLNLTNSINVGGLGKNSRSKSTLLQVKLPSPQSFVLQPRYLVGVSNRAPVLNQPNSISVTPGSQVDVQLLAIDPDLDEVSYSLEDLGSLPAGELNASGLLRFAPSPDQIGTYTVTAIASDSELTSKKQFTVTVTTDPITTTRVSGKVLDVDGSALVGIRVEIGSNQALTNTSGEFFLDLGTGTPATETIRIRGDLFASGNTKYPFIAEKLPLLLSHELYTGYRNVISRPIYLPKLDIANGKQIDPTKDTLVASAAIPGSGVMVKAGTLGNLQGTLFAGVLSLTEVPRNLTPAVLPSSLVPDLVVTVQPGEMVFSVPAAMSLPNRAGRPAGTVLDLWSINPTTGAFEIVGQGKVSNDGSKVDTISGGIRNSSWHFFAPPTPTPPDRGDNPPPGCFACPCGGASGSVTSEVQFHSGKIVEEHSLVTYQSLGKTQGVALYYDSVRADPRPIYHFGYSDVGSNFPDLRMAASITFSDQLSSRTSATNYWSIAENQTEAHGAIQTDFTNSPSGIYDYTIHTNLLRTSNAAFSSTTQTSQGTYTHINSIKSPFGAGWGIAGLREAIVDWDSIPEFEGVLNQMSAFISQILIVDGGGPELLYTGGSSRNQSIFYGSPGDTSQLFVAMESNLPVIRHKLDDGTVYEYQAQIQSPRPSKLLLTKVIDRNGNTTEYRYGASGNIERIVDPVGLETVFAYNANSRVSSITDPAGRITRLDYDANGNLAKVTDPDGTFRQWEYDSKHHMVKEVTKAGLLQETFYDFSGRSFKGIREDGTTISYQPLATRGLLPPDQTLNLANAPLASTDDSPRVRYVDSNGNVSEMMLDGRGQVVSSRDSIGLTVLNSRNDENQITDRRDADGNSNKYEYDDRGNVIEITDEITKPDVLENPTITWIGSVSGNWSDPANWSGNRLPGPSDDVLIDLPDVTAAITINNQSVSVNRLYSSEQILLNGLTLTVTGNSKLFDGIIASNSASIVVLGAFAKLIVLGSSNIDGGNLYAHSGGVLSMPLVTRRVGEGTIQATGVGSLLELPSLTSITNGASENNLVLINASGGGRVNMSAVTQITDPNAGNAWGRLTRITSDGAGSVVDLTALRTYTDQTSVHSNGSNAYSTIVEKNSGTVLMPSLTDADGIQLILSDVSSGVSLSQLTTFTDGVIQVGSGTHTFPNLTNLSRTFFTISGGQAFLPKVSNANGASFFVSGGVNLALPALLNYTHVSRDGISEAYFSTFGIGSVLDLPSLMSVSNGASENNLVLINASGGGRVNMSAVTQITDPNAGNAWGRLTRITSDGAGSVVDLTGLRTFTDQTSQSSTGFVSYSTIVEKNSGTVLMPSLTDADGIQLVLSDVSSGVSLSQLTTFTDGVIQVGSGTHTFPNLTNVSRTSLTISGGQAFLPKVSNANGASFFVSGGVNLALPALLNYTHVSRDGISEAYFSTFGIGSVLNLPSLMSVSNGASENNLVLINASGGGRVNMSAVTQITDPNAGNAWGRLTRITSDGAGSVVDLTGLRTFTDQTSQSSTGFVSYSTIVEKNSGTVLMPSLTDASVIQFALSGNSGVSVANLTSYTGGILTVQSGVHDFSRLGNFSATGLAIESGSTAKLPLNVIGNNASISNSGRLELSRSTLTVATYSQSSSGESKFGVTNVTEKTQVNVTGVASLAGKLTVEFSQSVALGSTFDAILYSSKNGTFASIIATGLADGLTIEPIYTATKLTLQVVAAGSGEGPSDSPAGSGNGGKINENAGGGDKRNGVGGAQSTGNGNGGLEPSGEGTALENQPLSFRYEPIFNQMVFASDNLGRQAYYEVDRGNGNILSKTTVLGTQPTVPRLVGTPLPSSIRRVIIEKMDGDTRDDVITVGDSQVAVLFSTTNGFSVRRELVGNAAVSDVAVFDIDKDGDKDIVVTYKTDRRFTTFKNNGDRTFAPGTDTTLDFPATAVGFGDLDKDGDNDLLIGQVGSLSVPRVTMYKNAGNGTLAVDAVMTLIGDPVVDLRVADFDGDGIVDLLATQDSLASPSKTATYWGTGSFAFAPESNVRNAGEPKQFQLMDFDNDGRLDIVSSNGTEAYFYSFNASRIFDGFLVNTRLPSSKIEYRDFDGDGIRDLFYIGVDSNRNPQSPDRFTSLQFGKGNNTFGLAGETKLPDATVDVFVADFDGDGKLDLGRVAGAIQSIAYQQSIYETWYGRVGDADDLITRYTYNPRGQIDTETAPNGVITDYDYDNFGRLVKVTSAKGTADELIVRYEYDPATIAGRAGMVTAMIDGNGNRTTYEYDVMNRLVKRAEPDPDAAGPLTSPITQMKYDAVGNLTESTDPTGQTSKYEYDARDRIIASIAPDPDGPTGPAVAPKTTYKYDGNGNTTATTDPLGKTTRYEYNARNQKTKSIDASGAVTKFEYDRIGNMSALTDPVGNRTTFEYDSRQRLIVETDPLGKKIRYSYDAANNLIQKIDRNDRPTLYTYDDQNRLITEKWAGPNGNSLNTIRYTYDAVGNPLTLTDNYSALTYTYDALNRVKTVDNNGTPGAPRVVLSYTYDHNGNVLSVVDTISGAPGATTMYQYDSLDRLSVLSQSGPQVAAKRVNFAYNQIGQYTGLDRYSDLAGTQLVIGTDYAYDSMNRLTAIDHRNTAGTAVSFFHYQYDTASRITRITDIDGTIDYGYDQQDQLTRANYSDPTRTDETYKYDANGNRVSSYLHGTGYVTGPGNRLLSDGTYNYEYDNEGNMTKRTRISGVEPDGSTIREFTWDHRNRLAQIMDRRADGGEVQLISYNYDVFDRRIAVSINANVANVRTSSAKNLVYRSEDVLMEFVDADGSGPASTQLAARVFHGPDVDKVFAFELRIGQTKWLLDDRLSTVQVQLDNDGAVESRLQYNSFGRIMNSPSLLTSSYAFTSREYDAEANLYFYRTRYYDAGIGAFTSEDQLRHFATGNNLFRYALNQPNRFNDAYGYDVNLYYGNGHFFWGVGQQGGQEKFIDYYPHPNWPLNFSQPPWRYDTPISDGGKIYTIPTTPSEDAGIVNRFDKGKPPIFLGIPTNCFTVPFINILNELFNSRTPNRNSFPTPFGDIPIPRTGRET